MRFERAIVRPPGSNFVDGLTTANLGRPVHALAAAQHEAYCTALRTCGLELLRLPADSQYPDSTFVEDVAVLTARGAILTRPGALSRRGETESMRAALAPFFPACAAIDAPGTLEGGDVCQADDHFFIGVSHRTNEEGARQLGAWLETLGYTSSIVQVRGASLLHLKSGLASLGNGRLAVVDALADDPAFRDFDRIRVPPGEEHAANCVTIDRCVLVPRPCPDFESLLQDLGCSTLALDLSEFHKMDGGLSCLSLRF